MAICRYEQSRENFVPPDAHIPSWGQTGQHSAAFFKFSYCVLLKIDQKTRLVVNNSNINSLGRVIVKSFRMERFTYFIPEIKNKR